MAPKLIHQLPESILLRIFRFLSLKDLGHASMVSTKWRRIAYDHSLWRDADLRGLDLTTEKSLTLINRIYSNVFRINLSGCTLTVSLITAIAERCVNLKSLR